MSITSVLFNRNPIKYSGSIEDPPFLEIKNTFSLWNASLDDAIKYGGSLTRSAIHAMNLRHDRKNIVVDTKVHMLMPGMSPAILGIHQDGSPRAKDKNPNGKDPPDILSQENDERYNRYHLLVTGTGCLTKFVNKPLNVNIPTEPSYDVYNIISDYVSELAKKEDILTSINNCSVVEFDWWNLHTGVLATKKEWRYLIRVCETDYYEPQTDLREIIRMQSQVYCPMNFSW